MVILAVDGLFGSNGWAGQQLEQDLIPAQEGCLHLDPFQARDPGCPRGGLPCLLGVVRWISQNLPHIDRGILCQCGRRHLSRHGSLVQDANDGILDHLACHHRLQAPAMKDLDQLILSPRLGHKQHPLLRLGKQKLPGQHPRFPHGHPIQVKLDAHPTLGGHLCGGAGDSRCPHILRRHHRPGGKSLQTGFDQALACKGIPHLHRRPILP